MIPILFEKTEELFTSSGIGRLVDCIECKVTEELNGVYECDFSYPVTGEIYNEIQLGRIIGVTHDDTGDVQPFDIVSCSKPIDGVVSFHATHISYRLARYVCIPDPNSPVDTFSKVLTFFDNAYPRLVAGRFDFKGTPGETTPTGYLAAAADGLPRSVRDYIGGVDGCYLDTFGGDVIWNKFDVQFTEHRGSLQDFQIRYGVNMMDYKEEQDGQETYTLAIPFWKGQGNLVVGGLVDSGLTPYDRQLCVAMDLTDKFETEPTTAQLEAEALSIMTSGQPNLPRRSIEVDFVRLQDLEDYGDYSNLGVCELGDSISVVFPAYNIQGTFRIVKVEWDALRDRFDTMTLGSLQTTLAEALGVGGGMTNVGAGGGGGSVVSFTQVLSSGTKIGTITIDGTSTDIYAPSGGGGGGSGVFYGTCGTAAGTAAKVVTCPSFTSGDLTAGTVLYVDFTYSNSVASPTLNVNSTGAKSIMRYGTTAPSTSAASSWNAGSIVCMVYDGTYWNIEGWLNTTYSSMTDAEYQAGTSTTARLITPARLKAAIDYWVNVTQIQTTGTKIATIQTGDTSTDIYAPTPGAGSRNTFWGTSSTAAGTATKDVACADWEDETQNLIAVLFSYGNTAQNPQLNVNSTGARPIIRSSSTSDITWEAGDTVLFLRRTYGGGSICYDLLSNGNAYAKAEDAYDLADDANTLAGQKSAVSWSQSQTTGTKIATVTIDGTPTDVYAPTGGGGGSYTATSPIDITSNVISHEDSGVGSAGYTTAYYDSKNGYYIPLVEYDSKGHLTDITNTMGTLIPLNTGTSGSTNPVVLNQYSWALGQRSYSNTGFTLSAGSTTQSQTITSDANSVYSYQSNFRIADVQAYDAVTYEPVIVDWKCDKVFSAGGSITVTVSIASAWANAIRWFPVVTYATAGM